MSGRGRLSKIELLPAECGPAVAWAAEALQDRNRTQLSIYGEFVEKLKEIERDYGGDIEFDIPSFKAFNRHSIKLDALTRSLDETRAIAGAIAAKFDAEASNDLTLIAAEAIKSLIFEMLTSSRGRVDPKGAMNLAQALRAATQAQGVSFATKQKINQEFAAKAVEVIDIVAKEKGMSAETVSRLRKEFLGVRPEETKGEQPK